ncbi:MAG: ATPase, T2SS/T4P/T4SS family [Candidatus Paceibacterota bacterium]
MADQKRSSKSQTEKQQVPKKEDVPVKETSSSGSDEELRAVLVEQKYVSEEDFNEAVAYAKERNVSVIDRLLSQDVLSKDILGQATSEYHEVPYADLNSSGPADGHTQKVPADIAHSYHAVLFREDKDEAVIATDDLSREGLEETFQELFPQRSISFAYAVPEDIDAALSDYRESLETRFAQLLEGESVKASEILDEIFKDALSFKASDIHLEPFADEVVVRFRVDGVLQEAGRVPKKLYPNMVNRIKVRSQLRIDTHNQMQDGAMRYEEGGKRVDMRVSIAPTLDGEKVAIRLLAKYIRDFSLGGIGLSARQEGVLKEAARKPLGIILVAGPTGSGKTTTLYAILKMLNTTGVNITTIEDPVEYRISGINQIQTNEEAGITFANGLRTIVRQDPDIILVGEIRDHETSEIALNAALTGHLMLSTFHANDAATGIPRLIDMGAEPFLVASTLEIIVAQRLVRSICENCRHSVEFSRSDVKKQSPAAAGVLLSGKEKKITLYEGKGCNVCSNTGYDGRSAVFEIIRMTQEMKELAISSPSGEEVRTLARKQGSESMFETGLEKVRQGETTLAELMRVVGPQEE